MRWTVALGAVALCVAGTPGMALASFPPIDVCGGDFNGDGAVTGADYVAWANAFGGSEDLLYPGSCNGDGIVSGADYVHWAYNLGVFSQAAPSGVETSNWWEDGVPGGDFNGDGCVTGADYVLMADHYFGEEISLAAMFGNTDGLEINAATAHYVLWASNFGEVYGQLVPEPMSLLLLGAGAIALLRRR